MSDKLSAEEIRETTSVPLNIDAPIDIPVLFCGKQIVSTFMSLREQAEHGYDRDLLANQITGAGAQQRDNRTPAQIEWYDRCVTSVANITVDMAKGDWRKSIPAQIKSASAARMGLAFALDKPVLPDDEKNG